MVQRWDRGKAAVQCRDKGRRRFSVGTGGKPRFSAGTGGRLRFSVGTGGKPWFSVGTGGKPRFSVGTGGRLRFSAALAVLRDSSRNLKFSGGRASVLDMLAALNTDESIPERRESMTKQAVYRDAEGFCGKRAICPGHWHWSLSRF